MTTKDLKSAPWGIGALPLVRFPALYSQALVSATISQVIANSRLNSIKCIDANRFLRQMSPLRLGIHTETLRAIISKGGTVFAWEFRLDTENWTHRFRRIYNLVLGLLDAGGIHIKELRQSLVYVVVKEYSNCDSGSRMEYVNELNTSLSRLVSAPWEYDVEDVLSDKRKKDERKLTGFICRKCYIIYESEIDDFITYNQWR